MQDELPRKTVESNVLLEWTERNFFDEVHLDKALLMFLHYDRLSMIKLIRLSLIRFVFLFLGVEEL